MKAHDSGGTLWVDLAVTFESKRLGMKLPEYLEHIGLLDRAYGIALNYFKVALDRPVRTA